MALAEHKNQRVRLTGRSLFLFSNTSILRRFLYQITHSPWFDYFILAAIITSCVIVAIQPPTSSKTTVDPYAVTDLALNIVFALEVLAKVVAHGFILHRSSYLRSPWNVFDFVVVVFGIASDVLAATGHGGSSVSLKFLRLFRVLRPLRLIAKLDTLKVVLDTILQSFRTLFHVSMFIVLLILLYAITGMELFGGKLHSACFDKTTGALMDPLTLCDISDSDACSSLNNSICLKKWAGIEGGLTSFDNIGVAVLTVIQVITMEDWVFILYKLNVNSSPWFTWVFFGSLIVLGGFFAVDLLMGVLGNQYLRTKQAMNSLKQFQKDRQLEKSIEEDKTHDEVDVCRSEDVEDGSGTKCIVRFRSIRNHLSAACYIIGRHNAFLILITVLVGADVIFSIVCVHMKSNSSLASAYRYWKIFTLIAFVVEISILVAGQRLVDTIRSGSFIYRFSILLISFADVIMHLTLETQLIGLTVVRGISLIRIFKFSRFWHNLSSIIHSFVDSIKGVLGLFIFLVMILIIYALLGNQLFARQGNVDNEFGSFDTFSQSLLLSFVLLTGDGWTNIMTRVIEQSSSFSHRAVTIAYFLSFVLFGNFILMNIFLSIIIDNLTNDFEELESVDDSQVIQEMSVKKKPKITGYFNNNPTSTHNSPDVTLEPIPRKAVRIASPDSDSTNHVPVKDHVLHVCADKHDLGPILPGKNGSLPNTADIKTEFMELKTCGVEISSHPNQHASCSGDSNGRRRRRAASALYSDEENRSRTARARALSVLLDPGILSATIPKHKSLFIFHHRNRARREIWRLVTSSQFTLVTAIVIVISSLTMAFDDPLRQDKLKGDIMDYIDYVFTGFFALEILLKSIAYGFLLGHKKCYMRNMLNALDAFVVAISVANLALKHFGAMEYSQLRVLRVIRVVRMLKVSSSLKHVINCLINSVQKIFYFLVLYILILLVYSIVGVRVYSEIVGSCLDPTAHSEASCVASNSSWQPEDLNFDNIGQSFSTLFVLSTMDDWFVYLTRLSEIPSQSTLFSITYIVTFILVMSFIMLNVFIALVIVVFYKEKEKEDKFKVLNKSAQECLAAACKQNLPKRAVPEGRLRRFLWKVVEANWFTTASMSLILLNTIFLMSKFHGQGSTMDRVQQIANIVFTVVFTIECILKLIAYFPRRFFRDSWCVFDAIVIIGSWVDIIADYCAVNFVNTSLFRLFRAARLAKVVGKDGDLRQLFHTLMTSLRSIPAIALLMGLLIYVYAILGMEMFGKIRLDPNTAINSDTNFQSFVDAVFVLIRVTTLDAWHEIMVACADVETPNCALNPAENCGTYASYPYFASFVFICSYLMTNLFLAVIMDNFVYLTRDFSVLDTRHIMRFKTSWMKLDKSCSGRLPCTVLPDLLRCLSPPLGCGPQCPSRKVYSKILKMHLHVADDGTVDFKETLLTLVLVALDMKASNEDIRDEIDLLNPPVDEDLLDRVIPFYDDERLLSATEETFYRDCASEVIAGYIKLYQANIREKAHHKQQVLNDENLQATLIATRMNSFSPVPMLEKLSELVQQASSYKSGFS